MSRNFIRGNIIFLCILPCHILLIFLNLNLNEENIFLFHDEKIKGILLIQLLINIFYFMFLVLVFYDNFEIFTEETYINDRDNNETDACHNNNQTLFLYLYFVELGLTIYSIFWLIVTLNTLTD
jgi:hypothetical protein